MEVNQGCFGCKQTFRVTGSPPPHRIVAYPIIVPCPCCGYPNTIVWREDTPPLTECLGKASENLSDSSK